MSERTAGPSLVELLVRQRECWARGERVPIEALLQRRASLRDDPDAVLDLIYNEIVLREQQGEVPRLTDYLSRFPHLAEPLRLQFEVDDALGAPEPPSAPPAPPAAPGRPGLPSTLPTTPPPPAPTLPNVPGCLVLEELGRGAMGVVYRAWQKAPNRIVALKVLGEAVPAGRVRTEAEAAARLQHPHIVQVFEVKEDAGRTCLVLEYVDGGNLAAKIAGRPQPPRDAARLVEVLARAMAYAHERGVVHRDLKPGNVLLDSAPDAPLARCEPKIVDFGLAKLLAGAADLTRTNDVLGTPCYMAPEQAAGRKDVGPAADVYSLGAILYELLTGRPPFLGATVMDTLAQLANQEPVPPRRLQPKVPRDLDTICLKCLRKAPQRRYPGALELAEDLARFQAGEPVRARQAGALERGLKWARRRPAAAALLVVSWTAGLLLLGGGLYFTHQVAEQRNLARRRAGELDAQLQQTRRLLFTAQLLRVGAVWENDPIQGQQMLEDAASFPPDLRDFAWGVLYGKCKRDRLVLTGHERDVQAVAFRPDGQVVASGGRDGLVKFWSPVRGVELASGHEHTNRVNAVAFSPAGGLLASACADGKIVLWDARTYQVVGPPLLSPHGAVRGLAFSRDGKLLAVNTGRRKEGVVLLYDVPGRRLRQTLPWRTQSRCGVAFSADGKTVACADKDHTIRLWDVAAAEERQPLRGHARAVTCVAFSPDGQTVVAGAEDGTVRLWDTPTGVSLPGVESDDASIAALAFSPDGQTLAVAGDSSLGGANGSPARAVRLWDLGRKVLRERLRGHRGDIHALAFSPDGKVLASAGDDRTVRLWDVARRPDHVALAGHDGRPGTVALAPDGRTAVWVSHRPRPGSRGVGVTVWDVPGGKARALLGGHEESIGCLAVGPDGQALAVATGGRDGPVVVKLWDLSTAKLVRPLSGPAEQVLALAFSPDGKVLAGASWGRTVTLWDVASGKVLRVLRGHGGPVTCLAFRGDGRQLASGEDSSRGAGGVKVWDVASGEALFDLPGHAGRVTCLAYAPDGQTLASGGADGRIKLWDVERGEERRTLHPGDRKVTCLAYSPDGQTLASGGNNSVVKLWDALMGQDRASLPGHPRGACAVMFTADGQTLASANASQGLRLWYSALPRE
jgi:WD40 repeat protein